MSSIRKVALALVAAATVALPSSASAQATLRNQDTYFTFSQPVELPNTTLPAGTYLFQLVDNSSNRHVVRVMSQDRRKIYTTLMAIPAYSVDRPPEKPEVRFMESPASQANAIKIWFYPGNSVGHEFIYPRNQALKLAKASGESVLTTKSSNEVSTTVAENDLTRVNPEGQDVETNMSGQRPSTTARAETGTTQSETATTASTPAASTQPSPAVQGTSGTTGTARPAGATGTSGSANTAASTRRSLPRTATIFPLLGLIGLGSIAASRFVRMTRGA